VTEVFDSLELVRLFCREVVTKVAMGVPWTAATPPPVFIFKNIKRIKTKENCIFIKTSNIQLQKE
jgi:hypothetical protein